MAEYGSLGRRPGVPYQARGGQEQGQKSSAARALLRAHLGDVGYVDAGSFGVLLTSRPLDDAIQTLLALGSADLRPHNHEAARRPQEFRFAMDARARGSSDGRGHRSLSRGEVVMPIRVVAKGRVTEGPSQLVGEESSVVFVLDPFPDPSGACLAHASEVVCPSHDLASTALETVQCGVIWWR